MNTVNQIETIDNMTKATKRNLPVICYTFLDGSAATDSEVDEHFEWLATATIEEITSWVDSLEVQQETE